ncbi:MAG: valine--tRNA ligase [Acidimicrobiia bacterium]|nr:valine--tRNA ligase [Acidimicrobiia bacterium]
MSPQSPEKPSLDGLEQKWGPQWEADRIYAFDRSKTRDEIFAIDTPPPTVSGSLHMGSVFGYAQTDTIARQRRMLGLELFYPMGWDDNGLATERRVQNYFGVRCDPTLPVDPDFAPPEKPGDREIPIARQSFVELCDQLVVEDEKKFEELWRQLGLSVDWSMTYTTIGTASRRASQRAFLRMLGRDEAYSAEAPTLWDVDDRTAVAQAELEDRDTPGAYHALTFHGVDGGADIVIETTRPELLPACVALVAHPDDERFRGRFGEQVRTPLFGVSVPVVAHALADPDKGSGIAMICTFGDTSDVVWWRELQLPLRNILGRDGRLLADDPEWGSDVDGAASGRYAELAGKTVKQARKRIVELLVESGELAGEPKPISHPVKFYERGSRPLEIVTSRQWYFRNGGRDPELRDTFLARGAELQWHPRHMRQRYDSWVDGLNTDWLVSRQRFFGVPIPVWYPLDAQGEPRWDAPLLPPESDLPIDPASDLPANYTADQRGRAGGFMADPDVMDTWATSSLTPQIATGWGDDDDLFSRTFPMDLRPQGPEIIRTWLFDTIVRAHFEHGTLPWRDTAINGWVLDPDRKKMSKSKGNVVTPMPLLEKHGSDAIRYWAASGRPGTDTAVDEGQMKVGRRLSIKLLNVSKFVLGVMGDAPAGAITAPIDRSMLTALAATVGECTQAFAAYDYARALERAERFFWDFCDDYVELVKHRAYADADDLDAQSARGALGIALSVLQRLFAPFLVYVTEEVWSWWQEGSIHRAAWPTTGELVTDGEPLVFVVAADVLGAVRKAKSEAKVSMRTEASSVVVVDTTARLGALSGAVSDVRNAGVITDLSTTVGDALSVAVTLAPTPS